MVRIVGFPHSDIPGSAPVHGSPRLFAVTHVLLRISVPGTTQVPRGRQLAFAYGTLTLFGRLSHTFPLARRFF